MSVDTDSSGIGGADYSVCTVRPADLPSLIVLCAEHARYERASYDPSTKLGLLKDAIFTHPARLFAWMAWKDGVPVGYATATVEFSTWAACNYLHMDCLFVEEQARGQAVGAKLLHVVKEKARVLGLRELQWQTPDWNLDAMRFYARHGASAKSKQRFILALCDT
jgi:GNAT superfamily N-acetyltransferase